MQLQRAKVILLSLVSTFGTTALTLGCFTSGAQAAPALCKTGYVWREAFVGDVVCVVPETRTQTAYDNSQVSKRINPGGGQYGAFSCRSGYVWREASPSDLVCVTPETRTQTAYDNSMAVDRVAPIPKAFGRVSAPPPICITAESARKRNSPAAPALEAQCRDATK